MSRAIQTVMINLSWIVQESCVFLAGMMTTRRSHVAYDLPFYIVLYIYHCSILVQYKLGSISDHKLLLEISKELAQDEWNRKQTTISNRF